MWVRASSHGGSQGRALSLVCAGQRAPALRAALLGVHDSLTGAPSAGSVCQAPRWRVGRRASAPAAGQGLESRELHSAAASRRPADGDYDRGKPQGSDTVEWDGRSRGFRLADKFGSVPEEAGDAAPLVEAELVFGASHLEGSDKHEHALSTIRHRDGVELYLDEHLPGMDGERSPSGPASPPPSPPRHPFPRRPRGAATDYAPPSPARPLTPAPPQ